MVDTAYVSQAQVVERYLWRGNRHVIVNEVTMSDAAGHVLARWGGPDQAASGNFIAPHDTCVDSHGDLYVAEVTHTFAASLGLVPPDSHSFQKFRRQA